VLSAWILGFCLVGSLPLRAQVTGATLTGTVTDASGAVIPNAQITATNKATAASREVTADAAGFYLIPNLLPGSYDVRASAKGFSSVVQSNLTLAVGAQQQLNFPMKVGETTQTVQVTEAAPQIDLTSSTLSGQIESETVRELPLNGRDWASLATLSPGVTAIENQMPFDAGAVRGNRGFGAQLTISGGRPTQNNYRLDGLSINDYGNGGPGSVLGVSLGVDAIQEFSVLTGNYSAEYGRTSGGVVNAISKSGTNAFHGDLYEFLRNDKLDARDFFLNAIPQANGQPQKKPPYKRNQFGASAGGPIRKDRTFIFGDYEGIRQVKGNTVPVNVPSDNARLGILAGEASANQPAGTPCTNGTAPGHYLSSLASRCVDDKVAAAADRAAPVPGFPFGYLDLYPHANGPVNGDKATFAFAGVQAATENFFTVRVDHKISDKDSLFGTYMYDKNPFTQPDPLITFLTWIKPGAKSPPWNGPTLSPRPCSTPRGWVTTGMLYLTINKTR
jgi:hypothetical protein